MTNAFCQRVGVDGVAIFYRTNRLELLASAQARYRDHAVRVGTAESSLRAGLSNNGGAIVLALLRCQSSHAQVCIGSTHLW
jgi:hypothetical protein